jgi:iron(III) transport system ATP-binding protein
MSVTLRDLRKTFAGKAAVDGISAHVATGEFFAIVGASGCGKSTLLRLIAGLERVDGGEIALGEDTVSGEGRHVAPEARGVGFVFQSYALWPHLDVRGNVAFPAEAAGLGRADAARQADRHLATVALADFATRKPADLSGGQRQRVALARCLAQGAQTILMDEPLANLDPHLRQAMEEELVRFHRSSGATTLYITHDQREAMAVADRMAVMADGRFLQVGPPDEVYARPNSARVARFIGQGAVQRVEFRSGRATLAGKAVPLSGASGPEGARQAMFRPADLAVIAPGEAGGLQGSVISSLYRGGHWEARIAVPGLDEPFLVHTDTAVRVGDALGLKVRGGWLLPDA